MLAVADEVQGVVARSRSAQAEWAKTELGQRLEIVRCLRNEIAASSDSLLASFPHKLRENRAERLASELIPLAEACRFLEREARAILAPRTLPASGQAFWLRSVAIEERRDPIGVVLLIGPANYPLFLPGVQALQALVAGNTVLVKPGSGGCAVIRMLQRLAQRAGLPDGVLLVFDEDIDTARFLIAKGVDKIVLTGSADTGRAVYRQAADHLAPLTLELSGCDPVFVQTGADLQRAVDAIVFGMRWNGGETCIAPRRIFVSQSIADSFERMFREQIPEAADSLHVWRYETDEQALSLAAQSPYALGASVFGPAQTARDFAAKVHAGIVVVNDMIVPTADPRAAFGGRGRSGFGTTRGAEGLRQFTALKSIIVQNGRRLRHLEPLPCNAEQLFGAYLSASHAKALGVRLRAWARLIQALWKGKRNAF